MYIKLNLKDKLNKIKLKLYKKNILHKSLNFYEVYKFQLIHKTIQV